MKNLFNEMKVFEDFTDDEIGLIESLFTVKSYELNETILRSDEINKTLFIVLSGKIVSSLKIPGSIDRKHGEYIRGDFFGEISLFGERPAFSSYIAFEKSELASIQEKDIINLRENQSGAAVKFISKLLGLTIQKLRKSNKFFADVVQWGESASRRVITDDLTGIYNRAFLEDAIENFFTISKSNKKPLSLLMLDIDNFRKINETIGLDAGNKVLQDMVLLIKNIISRHGIIARYGGDEFSILLPETDKNKARSMAEQIRSEVKNFDFSKHLAGHDIPVTTSIGISSYPDTANDLSSFKHKADASLYKAKETGRDKIACLE